MRRNLFLGTAIVLGAAMVSAQPYFSIDAGTGGFNLNVTNAPPHFPAVMVVPPPRAAVCVPLRPGVEYIPVSRKQYRKAVKRYRKAMRHGDVPAVGMMFPGGIVVGGAPWHDYYDDDYYDDIEDDIEDWLEDHHEHHHRKDVHKKLHKKLKKAMEHNRHKKHSKHHRHH